VDFINESNAIEGIERTATGAEIAEFERFMALPAITIKDIEQFVSVYQPDAKLRDRAGLNVSVGDYIPPMGDISIRTRLIDIVNLANTAKLGNVGPKAAYRIHCLYEMLHPFTDGNGRSGRMIWAWLMEKFPLGFLHKFYYQALQSWRGE
jgi:Fic family protein